MKKETNKLEFNQNGILIRDLTAKDRIIDSARKLFFNHGVNPVSMAMIAKSARVSKSTIYSRFSDKTDILRNVLEEECKRIFDGSIDLPDTAIEFKKLLVSIGDNIISLINDPEIIQMGQLMFAESIKHADITTVFFEKTYLLTSKKIEKIIAHGKKKKFISTPHSATLLSEILLSGWKSNDFYGALLGKRLRNNQKYGNNVKKVLEIVLGI